MKQTATIDHQGSPVVLELPAASEQLVPGVAWGDIATFPTPAYWAYRVAADQQANKASYKLGATLNEEIAACLLGGHGIPASVGLAAFYKMRTERLLDGRATEQRLRDCLSEPVTVHGRSVRYRFAAQKARYLAASLARAAAGVPTCRSGRQLRDWLLKLPGIGFKTASWIARNWLDADDVAILDVHILRAGHAIGLFPAHMTVTRHYLELEKRFLDLARAMGVQPSQLDAVIWYEMASSPRTVQAVARGSHSALANANQRHSHPSEPSLAV